MVRFLRALILVGLLLVLLASPAVAIEKLTAPTYQQLISSLQVATDLHKTSLELATHIVWDLRWIGTYNNAIGYLQKFNWGYTYIELDMTAEEVIAELRWDIEIHQMNPQNIPGWDDYWISVFEHTVAQIQQSLGEEIDAG